MAGFDAPSLSLLKELQRELEETLHVILWSGVNRGDLTAAERRRMHLPISQGGPGIPAPADIHQFAWLARVLEATARLRGWEIVQVLQRSYWRRRCGRDEQRRRAVLRRSFEFVKKAIPSKAPELTRRAKRGGLQHELVQGFYAEERTRIEQLLVAAGNGEATRFRATAPGTTHFLLGRPGDPRARFGPEEFRTALNIVLGRNLGLNLPRRCRCGRELDQAGHHLMSCRRGAFNHSRVHEHTQGVRAYAALLRAVGYAVRTEVNVAPRRRMDIVADGLGSTEYWIDYSRVYPEVGADPGRHLRKVEAEK